MYILYAINVNFIFLPAAPKNQQLPVINIKNSNIHFWHILCDGMRWNVKNGTFNDGLKCQNGVTVGDTFTVAAINKKGGQNENRNQGICERCD